MSLRARGLGKRLGHRWALRHCTLDLRGGTWLGVLGPNGAGKTTLLRLLATVLAPDEGVLCWRGMPVGQGAALRRCLGYLPQAFAMPPLPTVAAGLAYLAALKGIEARAQAPACACALAWAGVDDVAGERADRLSAGTLRCAGLAQAVLGNPAVLVLDEPEVGVDPARRRTLCGRLHAFATEGRIVLSAAHDPDFLEPADAVLLLDQGYAEGPFAVADFRRTAEGRTWVVDTVGQAQGGAPGAALAASEGGTRRLVGARPGEPPRPGAVPAGPTLADAYALWRLDQPGCGRADPLPGGVPPRR